MTRSLAAKSLWIDEALSVSYARQSLRGLFPFFIHGEMNMALYHLLLHFWLRLGEGETTVRSLSVLFALAAIPFAYAIGARLFSRRAGALSAIALALNGVFYSYAREARSYSLVILLVVAGSYVLLRALDDGRRTWWCTYVILMALAIYAHFFALFVVGAHFLSVFLGRRRRSERIAITLASAAVVALAVPAIVYIGTANPDKVTLQTTKLSDVPKLFQWFAVNNRPLLATYVLGALISVAVAVRRGREQRPRAAWPQIFLLTWLTVPIIGALIISYAVHPMFAQRYLLVAFPAFLLLAAAGLAAGRSLALLIVLAAALTGTSVRSLRLCEPGCATTTQNFRGVTAFVIAHASPTDRVLFDPPYLQVAYDYYARAATRVGQRTPRDEGIPLNHSARAWLLTDTGDSNTRHYTGLVRALDRRDKRLLEHRFDLLEVTLYQPQKPKSP